MIGRPPTSARRPMQKRAQQWRAFLEDSLYAYLPTVSKQDLPTEWQSECPVLCVAGRSLIDEAAAIMLAQLSTAHGLTARVEGADALTTSNIFRIQTDGVSIVCLVYMDVAGPAHMRYSVRRLRRKLPQKLLLFCAAGSRRLTSVELERLREALPRPIVDRKKPRRRDQIGN